MAIGTWLVAAFLVGHGWVPMMFAFPTPAASSAAAVDYPFDVSGSWLVSAGLDLGLVKPIILTLAAAVLVGFVLAGLVTVLIPSNLVASLLGEESGLAGVLIAMVAGILTPGGPYLQFPLVASLARGGAGVGPLAAYLTAWSLLGLNPALVWEIPLLGGSFAVARYAASITAPFLVRVLMSVMYRILTRCPTRTPPQIPVPSDSPFDCRIHAASRPPMQSCA